MPPDPADGNRESVPGAATSGAGRPTAGGDGGGAAFHAVDWDGFDDGRPGPSRATGLLLAAFAAFTACIAWAWAGFPAENAAEPVDFVANFVRPFSRLDWAMAYALVAGAWLSAGTVDRRMLGTYWARLRHRPAGLVSVAGVAVFLLVGAFAPLVVGEPIVRPAASHQPPVGFTVGTEHIYECVGRVAGDACRGTLQFPLGTTYEGHDVLRYTLVGTRLAFELAVVTAAIIVPVAVTVGTVAAYAGGRVDELLMGFTDAVGTIPPFVAYIVVRFVLGEGGDMLLLVSVFGLLGWAGVARSVRTAVLQRREALYVTAARSAGGSPWWVVRRHVLPNVSATVVATAANRVATLVLTEAALSYLDLGAPQVTSWGTLVAAGIEGSTLDGLLAVWWVSLVPAAALAATVVVISAAGDTVEAVVDPRRDA